MSDQPTTQNVSSIPKHQPSTLRDLTYVVMVVTGLVVVGQGWPIGREVFLNLGGGAGAWLACGVLLLIGLAILCGAVAQVSSRLAGRTQDEPSRKTTLVGMFAVIVIGGAIGSSPEISPAISSPATGAGTIVAPSRTSGGT